MGMFKVVGVGGNKTPIGSTIDIIVGDHIVFSY